MLKEIGNQNERLGDGMGQSDIIAIEILNKGVLDFGAEARIAVQRSGAQDEQCGCIQDCSCDINCSGCGNSCQKG